MFGVSWRGEEKKECGGVFWFFFFEGRKEGGTFLQSLCIILSDQC